MVTMSLRLIQQLPRSCPSVTAASVLTTQKKWASSESDVKNIGGVGTKLPTLKRGTGGRSSFNGVVATVFGCTGFLGRYLVNQLGKCGTQVILPYRGEAYDVTPLKVCGDLGQVLFQPFHLKDELSLEKAMKYSNVVINLIGRDYETGNFKFDDVHVTGARNIARIARECGVQKLIHLSALNAAEKPKPVILRKGSQFYASKWRGEQAVREEFPDAVIFRPSDIYGHEDRFCRYYSHKFRRTGKWIPLWKKGKDIIKQPVYVSDVAKGVLNAIFDENVNGQIVQAVGPRRYDLGEFVDWMFRVMRRGPEWGYVRYDMRLDLAFMARVIFSEMFFWKYPILSWERLEREHSTDEVTFGIPTLEDLGVTLSFVEDVIPYELKYHRAMAYYDPDVAQFEKVEPPPVSPL